MVRAQEATRIGGMSTISRDEVLRLADLARIDLTQAEATKFTAELDVIVEAVARVGQLVTPDVPLTSHPLPLTNVLRPDVPEAPLTQAQALDQAPESQDGKFLVAQILGEE